MRTDITGNPCETIQNLPFGDAQTITGSCGGGDPSPLHFTGRKRRLQFNTNCPVSRGIVPKNGSKMSVEC
jgi:hypothetical protein